MGSRLLHRLEQAGAFDWGQPMGQFAQLWHLTVETSAAMLLVDSVILADYLVHLYGADNIRETGVFAKLRRGANTLLRAVCAQRNLQYANE